MVSIIGTLLHYALLDPKYLPVSEGLNMVLFAG